MGKPISTGTFDNRTEEYSPYWLINWGIVKRTRLIVYRYDVYALYRVTLREYSCACRSRSWNPCAITVARASGLRLRYIEDKNRSARYECGQQRGPRILRRARILTRL